MVLTYMKLLQSINDRRIVYRLPWYYHVMILLLSPILLFVISVFMVLPLTRHSIAIPLLQESGPIENLTFFAAVLGTVCALRVVFILRRRKLSRHIVVLYLLLAAGLFFLAAEEIAWGQHLFGFDSPRIVKDLNAQDEFTFHNIIGIHGTSEIPQFVIGLCGLAWLAAGWKKAPNPLSVPRNMLPLLACIFFIAVGDLFQDIWNRVSIQPPILLIMLTSYFDGIDELNELFISTFGLLYSWLNARLVTAERQNYTF